MSDREYQHYSEAVLLDMRRQFEAYAQEADQQVAEYEKIPAYWSSPDYEPMRQHRNDLWNAVYAVDSEFEARRSEPASY